MSFSTEMRTRLIAAGLVTAANFFDGPNATVPAGDGPFVVITTTGGSPSELTQDSTSGYEIPGAQFVVTASVKSVAEAKAKAIRLNVIAVRNEEIDSIYYRSVTGVQQVFPMPLDASNRPRCAFNVSAIKRPS